MSILKRFIAGADNHGILACEESVKKFLKFADDWKPHYRIHLGDLWDFSPLRRGAGQEEKAQGISEDYEAGIRFLDAYKPNYLTLGNHDDRIWQHTVSCSDGILRERCQQLAEASEQEFRKRKIKWVPYKVNQYLRLPEGGPKLIHGFRSTISPAKAHFDHWGECLHGHCHTDNMHTARHIEGGKAFSVACLADLSQLTYSDRQPAKLGHRNGWIYGTINIKTGTWNAWPVIKESGIWTSPLGEL